MRTLLVSNGEAGVCWVRIAHDQGVYDWMPLAPYQSQRLAVVGDSLDISYKNAAGVEIWSEHSLTWASGLEVGTLVLNGSSGATTHGSGYLQDITTSVEIPLIGVVDFSAYATSPESIVFMVGFAIAAGVRMFRAALRWFKRAGTERLE